MALLVMAAWRDSTPNSHLRQSVEGGGAGASTADPRSMTSRSDAGTSGGSVSVRVSPSFGASSGHSFASAQSTSGVKSVLMTSMAFWTYISRRLSHWETSGRERGRSVSEMSGSARDEVTSPWRVWGEFLFPPRSGNYTRA